MNEIESLRQEFANIADQLIAQNAQAALAQSAQQGAYLMLLRHLSVQGYADLEAIQSDLELFADVQDDAALQAQYATLADAVQKVRDLPSCAP